MPVPGMRVKGTEDLVPGRDPGAARVKNGDLLGMGRGVDPWGFLGLELSFINRPIAVYKITL